MSHVALSMDYIIRMKQHIKMMMYNIKTLELREYDLGKSDILLQELRNMQSMLDGLRVITNNPEKYVVKI